MTAAGRDLGNATAWAAGVRIPTRFYGRRQSRLNLHSRGAFGCCVGVCDCHQVRLMGIKDAIAFVEHGRPIPQRRTKSETASIQYNSMRAIRRWKARTTQSERIADALEQEFERHLFVQHGADFLAKNREQDLDVKAKESPRPELATWARESGDWQFSAS